MPADSFSNILLWLLLLGVIGWRIVANITTIRARAKHSDATSVIFMCMGWIVLFAFFAFAFVYA